MLARCKNLATNLRLLEPICVNRRFTSQDKVSLDDMESYYANETGSIDECDTIITGFTDIYGRLMGKRMDSNFYKKTVMNDGTHGCNYLLTCDMSMNPQDGFKYSNWNDGYGDFHLNPDHKTFRKLSWLDNTGLVICDVCDPKTHKLASVAPRSILKNTINQLNNEFGYYALAASELEYYIYEDSYRDVRNNANYTLSKMKCIGDYPEDYHIFQGTRSEWINSQFRLNLRDSGIPVECTKGEAGIGQHELNIEYDEILSMCDKHIIYKQCLKEVADLNGVSVTFMCKPFTDSVGSGCHIHLSLWDKGSDKNVFVGNLEKGRLKGCSQEFLHFLGGWIKYTPEIFPFFAPTINSYKRFVSASWAPTTLAWSFDNRTAGFRIVGSGNSLRIEMRICGSDVNPYLVFASSLAAGLNGIKNGINPPDPTDNDIYNAQNLQTIPTNLDEAIKIFKDSKFANDTFGEEVVNHYAHFYSLESQSYKKSVTDWERQRYFEMI
eukprot:151663_1